MLETSTWNQQESLAKGISAGLWVDLESAWAFASSRRLAVTCKRPGVRLVVSVAIFWLVVLLWPLLSLLVWFESDRWIVPHLSVRTNFECARWTCKVTQPVQRSPLWPASWLPALDKSRGSKSAEVHRVWEFFDDRLQFMTRIDVLALDESLDARDVSRSWLVWSYAAEAALADAYRFAGGPMLEKGLVMGRGAARVRAVWLGGPRVRLARRNAADAHEGGEVFMCRDSSVAPLLNLTRRIKAVMDAVDALIRDGVSLARSVELTFQWDAILKVGPIGPVTREDLQLAGNGGLGESRRLVEDLHCRLSDFIHRVVVHRGDEAIRGWRNWLREDPLVHPFRWLRPDLVPPTPFLQCQPHLTPGGSGVLADPARIDEEFRKAGLPNFCRSGQREANLEEFTHEEVEGWLPLLPEVSLPNLIGEGFWASLRCLVCMGGGGEGEGVLVLLVRPVVHKTWVTLVCLLLDRPFRRRSTSGEIAGQLIKLPNI